MSLLETSQIIFDLVVSVAVIVITVFISVIAYEIIEAIAATRNLLRDIEKGSSELYKKIDAFLGSLFAMKFISQLFNKKKKK